MTSRLTEVQVDCHDPELLAEFWCAALGYQVLERDEEGVTIGEKSYDVAGVRAGAVVPEVMFARVPEGKTVKNRLHLDLTPYDTDQASEVARLLALGATHADVGQGDVSWVVLVDPEGNEFCVLRDIDARERQLLAQGDQVPGQA